MANSESAYHSFFPPPHVTKDSHLPWHQRRNMAIKTYTWVTLWFLISSLVVFWDAGYLFLRPRSMKGGDLHWIFEPYGLYQEIDHVYGTRSYLNGDGFPNAQSLMNVIENLLNFAYIYLAHVSKWQAAPLIGFTAAVMTLSKTILYMVQDYYCNFCATGHNPLQAWITLWVIPSGFWILFPGLIVMRLGGDLVEALVKTPRYSPEKKKK